MTDGAASSSPIRRVGRYALYSEIASGGMATVYLGRQQGQAGFARTVAIKRLHPHHAKEPDFVAMFLDEARLAARIRHPNVVPTLDVVAADGELFLVMEYVQGESLARLLRGTRQRKENAPTGVVAAVIANVLHGLHAAHEATSEKGEPLGLVHRDVSPHNVLIGTDGVARVVDFGVAKAAGRIQTTREGQLKGKIAYMAPEQITGAATRRTDVYAASVVLWEALTGKRLFSGENDASVMHQVMHAPVAPPSERVAGLDPAWDEIVLKGLEREEQRRWASAREMAMEIESRLPLARATEVGSWVESLARESLAKRAAEVTAVESASDVESVVAPHESAGSHPVSGAPPAPTKPSSESTASKLSAVSWPVSGAAGSRQRSRIAIAGVGVGVAVLATWAIVVLRSAPGRPEMPAATATDVAPPPAASSTPVESSPPPAPTALAATSSSASAPVSMASTRAGSAPPVRAPRPLRPKSDPSPATPKGTSFGSVLDTRH